MKTCLTSLQIEPWSAEREWTVEGIPVLTARLEVPSPTGKDAVCRRIRRYYRAQARAFLHYCERQLFPQAQAEYRAALAVSAPLPCFHAALSYHVTYQEGPLWSLYTQSCETLSPSAAPYLTRWGDTWDLSSGYPVPLSAFFPHGHWRRQLLALAEEDIRRRQRTGMAYDPQWQKRLRRSFNPRNYYLTEDALAFFLPMYAIAPPSAGIPVFTVPYGSYGLALPEANTPMQ